MKKFLLSAVILLSGGMVAANAQLLEQPKFFDNVSIGLEGGVTTPLNHGAFFGDMRGLVGLHIQKMITPVYGAGVEGLWSINTSSWQNMTHSNTMFDASYVGAYGLVNLNSLFGGWGNEVNRVFDIDVKAGAGWGHYYQSSPIEDYNYFATKVGLNFNFRPSEKVTITLAPSVLWDMSDADVSATSAAYSANNGCFNFTAGVAVRLGDGFKYLAPYNQAEVDALNARINELRGDLDNCTNALAEANARNRELAAALDACNKKAPTVIKESKDFLQTVRYVFFAIGKSAIRADQSPNVEQIAVYLKNHPKATVVVKGYASQDGPLDINERLAKERAQSVKDALVNKYGIDANRIDASGQGIGHMFDEETWNRVAICVLENDPTVTTK